MDSIFPRQSSASASMRIGAQCADSLAPDPLAGTHSVMSSEQDNSGRASPEAFPNLPHKVGFRFLESKRQASATGNSHRAIVSISYICPGDRFTVRRDKSLGKNQRFGFFNKNHVCLDPSTKRRRSDVVDG